MDVRIGVIQNPKEIEIELGDDTDRDQLQRDVDDALAADNKVLWITDRRGRRVGVPTARLAYIEIGGDEGRKVGFGAA